MNKDVHDPLFTYPRKDSSRGWIEESASRDDLNALVYRYRFAFLSENVGAGERILICEKIPLEAFAMKLAAQTLGAVAISIEAEAGVVSFLKIIKILKPGVFIAPKPHQRWSCMMSIPRRYSRGEKGFGARDLLELFPGVIKAPQVVSLQFDDSDEVELTWNTERAFENINRGVRTILPAVNTQRLEDFEPSVILDQMRRHGVTRLNAPASVVEKIARHLFKCGTNLTTVNHVEVTGGRLSKELASAFPHLFPRCAVAPVELGINTLK